MKTKTVTRKHNWPIDTEGMYSPGHGREATLHSFRPHRLDLRPSTLRAFDKMNKEARSYLRVILLAFDIELRTGSPPLQRRGRHHAKNLHRFSKSN